VLKIRKSWLDFFFVYKREKIKRKRTKEINDKINVTPKASAKRMKDILQGVSRKTTSLEEAGGPNLTK
jgi:hypothetical protein